MLTQTSKKFIASSLATLLATVALGSNDIGTAPDRGFIIQAQTDNGLAYKAGGSATLSAEIALVGKPIQNLNSAKSDKGGSGTPTEPNDNPVNDNNGNSGSTSGANGSSENTDNGNSGGKDDSDLLQYLKNDGIEIVAYFPDATSPVTSAVSIKEVNGKIQLKYTTPSLDAADLNTFTVQLTRANKSAEALQRVQAKLDRRITAITAQIKKLGSDGTTSQSLQELKLYADHLKAISHKIARKLASRTELLAESKYSLLIDNTTPQPSVVSTVMGKFRFSLSYDPGTAIQGETAKVHTSILNLRKGDEAPITDDSSSLRLAQYYWNEEKIKDLGPQPISNASELIFDYETPKLLPSQISTFRISLFNWDSVTSSAGKRIGTLSLKLPVAEDPIAPTWLAGATPDKDHPYVQNMQLILASVQDPFGRIDPTAFTANLTGLDTNGAAINRDVRSSLETLPLDQGRIFEIRGDLNPLPEGTYTFSLGAQDFGGKPAAPNPLKAAFRIDRTPPTAQFSLSGKAYTNQPTSNLSVSVNDLSPTTTQISQNLREIINTSEVQIPVRVSLREGLNAFSASSRDAAGNVSTEPQSVEIVLDTIAPVISSSTAGNQITNQATFSLPVSVADSSPLITTIFQNGIEVANSIQPAFTYSARLQEGPNTFELHSVDAAGNVATPVRIEAITLDPTPPLVILGNNDGILTNRSVYDLPITVVDNSPTNTSISHNGTLVGRSSELSFSFQIQLSEGPNVIEVTSIDAAGNSSPVASLSNITLDTIPPTLAILSPSHGSVINTIDIPVSGSSNEPLSSISVNNVQMNVGSNPKTFFGTVSAQIQGAHSLQWVAKDEAGNITTINTSVDIVLRVLNGNLISVTPHSDGEHLVVNGAAGAARPGITVECSASLFNYGSTVSAGDGSFSILMKPFRQAKVSATDPSLERTETADITFGANGATILAGVVQDISGTPLPKVRVTLEGTGLSTETQGDGSFAFHEPITGDNILIIDGTTIPREFTGGQKEYSKTRVAISVGLSQSNVFDRPFYLTPVSLAEGESAQISPSSGGTVALDTAPGTELDIPAGSAVFPNEASQTAISMVTAPSSAAVIPPPDFAKPNKVTILEPSGLTFTKRAKLTLPNDSQLPPGTDMVIFSMNSKKGIWEVDGIAQVSSDGSSIVTKDGEGISHFSVVYPAPLSPIIRQLGAQDQPGADAMNGSLRRSIDLPSFSTRSSKITPSLIYDSSWVTPKAVVSTLIDIPKRELHFDSNGSTVNVSYNLKRECLGIVCYWVNDYEYVYYNNTVSTRIAYEPEFVTAQFFAPGITSDKIVFNGVPNQSVVSYAMDLKDSRTGARYTSGVYPYTAKFELKLKEFVLTTATSTITSKSLSRPIYSQESHQETRLIEELFPQDLSGQLFVQNEEASAAGRGWRLAGVQRIVNPDGSRVMIQEGDGSVSSYALADTMDTVLNANDTSINLQYGVDLSQASAAKVTEWDQTSSAYNIRTVDLTTGLLTAEKAPLRQYHLKIAGIETNGPGPSFGRPGAACIYVGQEIFRREICEPKWFSDPYLQCNYTFHQFHLPQKPAQILTLPTGRVVFTDSLGTVATSYPGIDYGSTGGHSYAPRKGLLVGDVGHPAIFEDKVEKVLRANGTLDFDPYTGLDQSINNYCQTNWDINCPRTYTRQEVNGPSCLGKAYNDNDFDYGTTAGGDGPIPGFNGDGHGTGTPVRLNRPMGITAGTYGNTLVFADTGNNRVRSINLDSGAVVTIAGNGQTNDFGDGGFAVNAGIFHPRGVVHDSLGNLYISTENGLIRRVNAATKRIERFAGNINGVASDYVHANDVKLSRPYGMAIHGNGLFVADTEANLVRRIDLTTRLVSIVAGTGQEGFNGDGRAALNSNLSKPTHLGFDSSGNLLIVDSGNQRIRRVVFQNSQNGPLAFEPTVRDNSTLQRLSDGRWQRSYRSGVIATYLSDGHQAALYDPSGLETRFVYDDEKRLTKIVDVPTGRFTQFDYTNTGGLLSAVTDPANRVTRFHYDEMRNLRRVTFPDGTERQYDYDPNGKLRTEHNEKQLATVFDYNDWGRLKSVTHPDQTSIVIEDLVSQTVANSYVAPDNIFERLRDPEPCNNSGTTSQLDASFLRCFSAKQLPELKNKITSSNGEVIQWETDPSGHMTLLTTKDNQSIKMRRDVDGRPVVISKFDAQNNEIAIGTYRYDDRPGRIGDLLEEVDLLDLVRSIRHYDRFGNTLTEKKQILNTAMEVTAEIDSQTNTYDSFGRPESRTNTFGSTTSYTYNGRGLLETVQTSPLPLAFFSYDSAGNLEWSRDPSGKTTTYARDPAGNLKSATDPKSRKTEYQYDSLNRLLAVKSAVGTPTEKLTRYSYFPGGQLREITDPYDQKTAFVYDEMGRLKEKTDAYGSLIRAYDTKGRLYQETDPNKKTKTYEYDDQGRLARKLLPDDEVVFDYDQDGRLESIRDNDSIISYSFDKKGRILSVSSSGRGTFASGPASIIKYSYDALGNRATMDDQAGITSFSYESFGRLSQIKNSKDEIFSFGYSQGRLSSIQRPGSLTRYDYNGNGRLEQIQHLAGTSILSSFGYELDDSGVRVAVNTDRGRREYFYDPELQITSATNPEVPSGHPYSSETFSYDSAGNRTSDQGGSFVYDSAHKRIQEDYRFIYLHDSNGNLISKQDKGITGKVTNFIYSSENQLVEIRLYEPGSTEPVKTAKYRYDALGRRIEKNVVDLRTATDPKKTFTRRFIYDGENIIQELDGSNTLLVRYTHAA